jgi:hypothetical protein
LELIAGWRNKVTPSMLKNFWFCFYKTFNVLHSRKFVLCWCIENEQTQKMENKKSWQKEEALKSIDKKLWKQFL